MKKNDITKAPAATGDRTNQPEILPVYAVPRGVEFSSYTDRLIEGGSGRLLLRLPCLTPEIMMDIMHKVAENRKKYLAHLKTADIVDKIDAAVQKWLNPEYELRRQAETWLPAITDYDPEMIRLELKRFMRTFRKKELLRFLDEEFDQAAVLDEFRPRKSGGMSRAYGPESIFHVFSGNVPGLPVWSLVMGLLVKSGNIGKTSSAEPLMAVLFVRSLYEVDADLADTIAILPWKGGTSALEEPVIAAVDAVIAYGADSSVERIREQVPGSKRFLRYGSKVSMAMVGREALTADRFGETVHRLADDVSTYDQQGCLSPHAVVVEDGGAVSARQFAQLLAAELQRCEERRPRAAVSQEEALAIRRVRNQYELAALNGESVTVYSSKAGTEWTVIYHQEQGFAPSPLNRTIHVFGCTALEDAPSYIEPYRELLQTVGIAVGPERLQQLADLLGTAGVNRICAIGKMSRTPAGWHHDGRFNLLDLVRWTDIEWSAEQEAERYDPDAE
ncbi:MAG: acyl-CoA reductase LuxC [Paenibacillaceae bacterium]|jgi:hypothetical protein|nr:acyl-CoA reductase LuxC [Paenibacillaceae bacterium]